MAALIIGATGGIGAALARAWPREALWLAAHNDRELEPLAAELQSTPVITSVEHESDVRDLFDSVTLPLDTIVYAAGTVTAEFIAVTSPGVTHDTWHANYFGVLWTLKYGLSRLSREGRAYFLSATPETAIRQGCSQYAATQAALVTMLDVARLEHPSLSFTLVRSPAVDTSFWKNVPRAPQPVITPERVAESIIRNRFEEAAAPYLDVFA